MAVKMIPDEPSVDERGHMLRHVFHGHGRLCASHPWEVIVGTLTLTLCLMSIADDGRMVSRERDDENKSTNSYQPWNRGGGRTNCWQQHCTSEEGQAMDMIFMTTIRCVALLYCYHQFRNLHRMGSKYVLGISGLFAVFSSFVFSSFVINMLHGHASDLKDALFFFLLLTDLSKASVMAQLAVDAQSQSQVEDNIAQGMELLGPALTLDTIVETLLIGVGTLSGVARLEMLSAFACLSAIVNYVVFMTVYPACLSLILELSGDENEERTDGRKWLPSPDCHKSNPLVLRVKLIMAAGLMLVHAHSRWPLLTGTHSEDSQIWTAPTMTTNTTESQIHGAIIQWITSSAERIVLFILMLALAIKYILFEDKARTAPTECNQIPPIDESEEDVPLLHLPIPTNVIRATFTIGEEEEFPTKNKYVQTEQSECVATSYEPKKDTKPPRPVEECLSIYREEGCATLLTDDEVISLIGGRHIASHQLEKVAADPVRGVAIRRRMLAETGGIKGALQGLPFQQYDYSKVLGACCENVIGYIPVPVGVAGPLPLDGKLYYVPMATTEGCLVASTNRGCRALMKRGVSSQVVADGMTRGPVLRFPSLHMASEAMKWLQDPTNFATMKTSFDSTSRFARLEKVSVRLAGRLMFARFVASTGDAMGMNMLSKGTEKSLSVLQSNFPDVEVLSLSGNTCTDKKPAAINWIEGRGKSVVCEAVVPCQVVESVLKTTVAALVDLNTSKNLVGSAMAGSIGGFNAHAANIVTAIFISTGQDPAQTVGSSNCMTLMEPSGEDLYISCTMPSLELGTIGGGTVLDAQSACLKMMGVQGASAVVPGANACQLASIVCATVLAGELSLMAALAAGHLVRSHLKHNRSSQKVGSVPHTESTHHRRSSHLIVPPECRQT